MESVTTPPDPLLSVPPDAERRGSHWWAHPAHRSTREAQEWATVAKRLAKNDWSPGNPYGKGAGDSITAFRALWAGNKFAWIARAFDEGLVPDDAGGGDWWANAYFRGKSMRDLFLPERFRGSRPEQREAYDQANAARHAVADQVLERWPHMVGWFLDGVKANSLYAHPLAILTRPGLERDLARLLPHRGYAPLLEPGPTGVPLATPSQLLGLALTRRSGPLLGFALAHGAGANDVIQDYKGADRSMLHEALSKADPHARDWLLDNGAGLEAWDRFARTPFLTAARLSDVESMEKLAAAGANVHATDRYGQNAAHLVLEGMRTTTLDWDFLRAGGDRRYIDKTPEQLAATVEAAGQAMACLMQLGVDTDAVVKDAPKNTKKTPSPFATLPRAPRQPHSGVPGDTWQTILERRQANDPLFPAATLPRLRQTFLEKRLAILVPPEPEEVGAEPVLDIPVPSPPRRMRL